MIPSHPYVNTFSVHKPLLPKEQTPPKLHAHTCIDGAAPLPSIRGYTTVSSFVSQIIWHSNSSSTKNQVSKPCDFYRRRHPQKKGWLMLKIINKRKACTKSMIQYARWVCPTPIKRKGKLHTRSKESKQ